MVVSDVCLCGLPSDAEDPLRERALGVDPIYASSGLSQRPLETDDIRLRFIDRAPAAALLSLRQVSGGGADAARLAWAEREPSAVIESLAGREDVFAAELRARLWKQVDLRSRGLSLVDCSGEDATQRREQVFARDPVLGAITLRGIRSEQGDYWLRQLAPHAPKVVLRSIGNRGRFCDVAMRVFNNAGREHPDRGFILQATDGGATR